PLTLIGPEHAGRRLESSAEALEIARRAGDRVVHMTATSVRTATLLETGRMGELRALAPEFEQLLRDLSTPWLAFFQKTLAGTLALVQGRFEEAEEMAVAAREGSRDVTGIDPEGVYGLQMFSLRREQGRLDLIAPALRP